MHILTYTFKKYLKKQNDAFSDSHWFEKVYFFQVLYINFYVILYFSKFYRLTTINFIISKRNAT